MDTSEPVALFVTCLVDQFYPEIGVAAVKLLRRAGYRVAFPMGQTCCGQPFFNSGFRREARRLAKRTVDLFADYEAVILPGGSCAAMLRAEYPHLLADDVKYVHRARRLSEHTFELSEFLVQQAQWPAAQHRADDRTASSAGEAVTVHDSCHMCRTLGLREEPRTLLSRAGYRIEELAESDRCCGFGGLFSLRFPEVSNAMTSEKVQQAADSGAAILVTADPGCLLQMRGLAGELGPRVEHIAVMLEQSTR